jgi:hypothetical protein
MAFRYPALICGLLFLPFLTVAQEIWSPATYPDEVGFVRRSSPMLERLAAKGFGLRSLASSKCPDTGLPVKTWAVEGETIVSPYTGRTYIQGPTGYFGPKKRNEAGKITAFGGDPLKYDLPPATARLLLNPQDPKARSFLSIPGNMRQQYHFACKNWARFYALLGEEMGPDWQRDFYHWVGIYAEKRRPSDGNREHNPMSVAHNLVGQPGYLLGGNPLDGGTENHKTMWRTSALVYSQLFPDTVLISGHSPAETKALTQTMIRDYLQRILYVSNGEYDSQVYYPHSIEAFLNLYDFSTDPQVKELAQFALDYYFLTYGLKVVDGTIAGAQKRGYLASGQAGEMESMLWAFFDHTSRDMDEAELTIQQATTTYRPNEMIWKIVRKEVPLPFEAKMSRPFYHMDRSHAFAETFYYSPTYALGNVQMTIVDNPNQQMVWSLVARGEEGQGPLCFSGGHPMRGSTSGHSPYTQTLQARGSLLLLTAPTQIITEADTLLAPNYRKTGRPNIWHLPLDEQGQNHETRNRQKYAAKPLHPLYRPQEMAADSLEKFWQVNRGSASSWLYYPQSLHPEQRGNNYFFEAGEMFLAVIPLAEQSFLVEPTETEVAQISNKGARGFFENYRLLVVPGEVSGFIIETGEKSQYQTLDQFAAALQSQTRLDTTNLASGLSIRYETLAGQQVEMRYQATGLRCQAVIDGEAIDWDDFTGGAVYESPYLNIKNGIMKVNDGEKGYEVDFRKDHPIWKQRKP